ncbi:TPA: ROK family protein [Candidatus Bathyarchaeota archaeon]|nr:ROK family protein [Candidatus Bathyarchaeota archaeon]
MTRYAVGVDLGGTNIRAVLGDDYGNIHARIEERTERNGGPQALIEQIICMVRSVTSKVGLKKIKGVGVASAGTLDPERKTIKVFANLPFNNIPIVEPLQEELRMPVKLLNDCSTAVVGEKNFGKGKDVENIVYITISTGIGGGVYVDGKLLFGKDGNAHEVGHMTIDMSGRLICGCGKRGHWEAYCSGENIPKYARLLLREKKREFSSSILFEKTGGDPQRLTSKTIFDSAKQGDAIAMMIVDEVGRANAIGFANVVNLYDPELITVGGTVTLKNPELVMNPIRKYLPEYSLNRIPNVMVTPLGGDVVLYGALAIVFKDIV